MDDAIIQPRVRRPRGIPPKRLVPTLFALATALVLVLSWATSTDGQPRTGDGIARQNAARLSAADKSSIGTAAVDVRAAAERSGPPADLRPRTVDGSGRRPPAPLPAGMPLPPAHARAVVTPLLPPARDPAEVAREVEAINSRMAIVDLVDERDARAAVPPAPSGSAHLDAASQAGADAVAAALRQQQAGADLPGAGPRRFQAEMAQVRTPPGLRQNAPAAGLVVLEGTVIPAVLLRDVVSDLPGVLTAAVTQDVYDTASTRHVLVCKGSRLVGQYSSEVLQGQSRLMFAFTRLILPDGSSFDLGGFDGADASGRAGVAGEVDHHFLRIYGSALLTGLLADRVSRPEAVPRGDHAQPSATGQVMMDAARDMLQRQQRVAPTITLRRGTRIQVEVRRDLLFAAGRSCA